MPPLERWTPIPGGPASGVAAHASAGWAQGESSSQSFPRAQPLVPASLALGGQAPSGWGPVTHLRVLCHPTGLLCALRWGPLSGPLKEERHTIISSGAWLIIYPRPEAPRSPVTMGRYCREQGGERPVCEGGWDPWLLKVLCFREATLGATLGVGAQRPTPQLGTRACDQQLPTWGGMRPFPSCCLIWKAGPRPAPGLKSQAGWTRS